MNKWNIDQVPSQPGKIAVVTGANNGIGYETTLGLVKKDIEVIMMSPYKVTLDGFENQLATNYLGHFALTGLLLPLLTTTSGSRIVTLSSLSYKQGIFIKKSLSNLGVFLCCKRQYKTKMIDSKKTKLRYISHTYKPISLIDGINEASAMIYTLSSAGSYWLYSVAKY